MIKDAKMSYGMLQDLRTGENHYILHITDMDMICASMTTGQVLTISITYVKKHYKHHWGNTA